jgi:replicative superfamily II helicase
LTGGPLAHLIVADPGAPVRLAILDTRERLPWCGHSARYAMAEVYAQIRRARLTLVFVNTRSQAELVFQELWRINKENLAIPLHHGSLDAGQRRRVETAMVTGRLKAVVCTSTLTSAWIGATSISSSTSALPRGQAALSSGSAELISGLMSPRKGYSFPPIGLKCWNAARR